MRQFGAQRVPLGSASRSILYHHWARCEGSVRLGVRERVMHTTEAQRRERRVHLQRSASALAPSSPIRLSAHRTNLKKKRRDTAISYYALPNTTISAGDYHHVVRETDGGYHTRGV